MPPRKTAAKPKLSNVGAILNRETSDIAPQSIDIEKIHLPDSQPRRYFDPEKLAQLIESVKEHGILEPLLVRPRENGDYELVAGERRLRAARELGLKEVPIAVRELDDRQALQVALMENLQREDLNPVEETEAVIALLTMLLEKEKDQVVSLFYQAHHAKHRGKELEQNVLSQLETIEKVIASIGRFTVDSFRSSRLPLLKLPADVLEALRQGKLEYTKASAIARVKNEQQRAELLQAAVNENLSLSEIRQRIQELPSSAQKPENNLAKRYSEIGKKLKKDSVWKDNKKRKQLEALLTKLEKLVED